MTTLTIPSEYGYVLLVAASTGILNIYLTLNTSKFRKAAGIKYPAAYASNEVAEKDINAKKFNCAVRAHANTTENMPNVLTALLVSGIKLPVVSAALGAVWVVSRVIYAQGYSTGEPAKRNRGGFGSLAGAALIGTSIYSAITLLPQLPKF